MPATAAATGERGLRSRLVFHALWLRALIVFLLPPEDERHAATCTDFGVAASANFTGISIGSGAHVHAVGGGGGREHRSTWAMDM